MPRKPKQPTKSQKIAKELQKLLVKEGFITVAAAAFPQQREVIEDPSRYKSCLCARRAGKSYGAGIYLYHTAFSHPGSNCLYITTNHKNAKTIMFKDIMEDIATKHGFIDETNFNWNELTITLENGSVIRFMGLDANPSVSNSIYGGKYKLAVIDECAIFRYDLEELIFKKLRWTLSDQRGTILLIGTADNINDHNYFYQITRDDVENRPVNMAASLSQWKVWKWTGEDNPNMKAQFEDEIAQMKAIDPMCEDDPAFQQMYRNKWTTATTTQVYAYGQCLLQDKQVHYGTLHGDPLKELPGELSDYRFVAGVDFGFNDHSAIVVGAFSKYDPVFYVVDCFKQAELDASMFAEVIKEYQTKYNIRHTWADPAQKQMIQDVNPRYDLRLLTANKLQKHSHINIMNAAFYMEKIRLHEDSVNIHNTPQPKRATFNSIPVKAKGFTGLAPLMKELKELPWDHKRLLDSNTYQEHPAFDNHLTDALLYCFHESRHYRIKDKPTFSKVEPYSPEYFAQLKSKKLALSSENNDRPWFMKKKLS